MFPGKRAHRFFVTMFPAREKTRSDVTDDGGQDKYESASRVSDGHRFLWRYQYPPSSSRLALPSGERTGNTGSDRYADISWLFEITPERPGCCSVCPPEFSILSWTMSDSVVSSDPLRPVY